MATLIQLVDTLWSTVLDVAPILLILVLFQVMVLRQKVPHLRRMILGFIYVVLGLDLFLVGLEMALFPLGEIMARQLTDPAFMGVEPAATGALGWRDYLWVYAFAAAIGFSTTIAEPALIAVSLKVTEVSGGAVKSWGLRVAVAVGVALGTGFATVIFAILLNGFGGIDNAHTGLAGTFHLSDGRHYNFS